MSTPTITAATGAVGAYVEGIDLRSVTSDQHALVVEAWHRHGVLFFRDQHLTSDEHVSAARLFGEPAHFAMAPAVNEHEFVHQIWNDSPKRYGGATSWHTDATWKPAPPRGSMLQAIDLPPIGGDTLFATAHGAYESLSGGLQRMVLELTATHAGGEALARAGKIVGLPVPDPVGHPIVRQHPNTGEPCLFVNGVFTQHINDIPRRESNVLLPLLWDQFKDPELQCRFSWKPGDVAIWDNRAVQHYASPDYQGPRMMHRVVLAGDPVDQYDPA